MEKVSSSLDTEALRSFVAGIDAGSFALAAQRLCRSTSAVSAQLKKLEQQCGTALTIKKGRHLELTASGEILLGYARRLLTLNDEALRAVKGELLQGEIRIGMQEDFGESVMPGVLGHFSRQHSGVKITARIDRNQMLINAFTAKSLDMALIWQPPELTNDNMLIGQCPLEWIHHPDADVAGWLKRGEPLPLVVFESPCVMRSRATSCLDRAGIPWRIVFTSHSLSGIWAAVQAGLGITVRTRAGLPANLAIGTDLLPAPGSLGITVLRAENRHDEALTLLQQLMVDAAQRFTHVGRTFA